MIVLATVIIIIVSLVMISTLIRIIVIFNDNDFVRRYSGKLKTGEKMISLIIE